MGLSHGCGPAVAKQEGISPIQSAVERGVTVLQQFLLRDRRTEETVDWMEKVSDEQYER
jgi:hypothetical protein